MTEKLKEKAKMLGKLGVIYKNVNADCPIPAQMVPQMVPLEEEEEEKEEDLDGFQIRQLLISIAAFTVPGKYDKKADDTNSDVSDKLLNCIRRVSDMTSARRLSAKLQSFLLEWLKAPPANIAFEPLDQQAFVQSRKEFFQTYRAETRKWEGRRSLPAPFGNNADKSLLQSTALAASKMLPERKESPDMLWKQEMKASRGSLSSGTGSLRMGKLEGSGPDGSTTASSPCISRCRTAPDNMEKRKSAEMSVLRIWKRKSDKQLLAETVGKSVVLRKMEAPAFLTSTPIPGYFEMLGPRRIGHRARAGTLLDTLPFSSSNAMASTAGPSMSVSLEGCSEDEPPMRPHGDSSCPLCVNRSVDHIWEDPPASSRRIDISKHRMRKPQPGGAAMEYAKKVQSGRMRLMKPMLEPLELNTAGTFAEVLHPYGRSQLEAVCAPVPKCRDMPLLAKAASESAFVHKDPPPGGQSSKHAARGVFEDEHSAKTVQNGRWRYFKECERLQLVPRMPEFLLSIPKKGSGVEEQDEEGAEKAGPPMTVISVRKQGMHDRDLDSLMEPLRGTLDVASVRMDLSRNEFSDEAVAAFLEDLPTRNLSSLDLSFCGAATAAVDVISRSVEEKWTKLQVLQLAGRPLSDSCWEGLADACINYADTTRIDFVDMMLGRRSQQAVLSVAKIASSARRLEHLDISSNYIFYEGFEALGEALRKTQTLRVLDVSHNAATQGVMRKRQRPFKDVDVKPKDRPPTVVSGPDGRLVEEMPVFHPAALLVEALNENATLQDLRLSNSFIDFTVDCTLLLAVTSNKTLQRVDLSDNPHGEDGLRALLRLVVTTGIMLEFINVSNVRGAGLGPGVKALEFGAPGGHYDLDFSHPQHRALVRWLLRTANTSGRLTDPLGAFTVRKWSGIHGSGPAGKHEPWFKRNERTGGWEVPTSGRIIFDFTLDLKLGVQKTALDALKTWQRVRRVPVTLGRFVPLLSMFNSLTSNQQKEFFVRAMSDICLLKICHLMQFAKSAPEISDITVPLLYPHLLDPDQLLLFDVQHLHRHLQADFRREARSCFFWNTHVPTNTYVLHLTNPMDRAVAERLHVVNHFDTEILKHKKAVDTSQYGNHEGARNVRWEGVKYKSFVHFHVPSTGALSLDYVSPLHCSPTRKDGVTPPEFFDDLVVALHTSPCGVEDKVNALRLIAHHLVFDPRQVHRLCELFPSPSAKKCGPVNPNLSDLSSTDPMSPMSPKFPAFGTFGLENFNMEGNLSSAFMGHVENGRAEMFVLLFTRCVDVADLCTYETLWDPDFFTFNNVKKVRDRLGFMRTLDVVHLDRTYGIAQRQVVKRWEMWQINEALIKARRAEADGTTKDGVSIEGATSIVHEPGRRYIVNLAVHEERRVGVFLMAISDKEEGENLVRCDWDQRGRMGADEVCDYFVPGNWHTEEGLPKIGVFSGTYMSENEEFIQIPKRMELAETILGWQRPSTRNEDGSLA